MWKICSHALNVLALRARVLTFLNVSSNFASRDDCTPSFKSCLCQCLQILMDPFEQKQEKTRKSELPKMHFHISVFWCVLRGRDMQSHCKKPCVNVLWRQQFAKKCWNIFCAILIDPCSKLSCSHLDQHYFLFVNGIILSWLTVETS